MTVAELIELLKHAPQDLDVILEHDFYFQPLEEKNTFVVDEGDSVGVYLTTGAEILHSGIRPPDLVFSHRLSGEGFNPRPIRDAA
jgi:hypothetical protein